MGGLGGDPEWVKRLAKAGEGWRRPAKALPVMAARKHRVFNTEPEESILRDCRIVEFVESNTSALGPLLSTLDSLFFLKNGGSGGDPEWVIRPSKVGEPVRM